MMCHCSKDMSYFVNQGFKLSAVLTKSCNLFNFFAVSHFGRRLILERSSSFTCERTWIMDQSLFLILCLSWIILPGFFPPLSSTCPSRTMSPPPPLSLFHFLSLPLLRRFRRNCSLNPPTLHLFSARCCCISLWVPLRFVFTSFSQILFISLFSLFPSVWFPSVYFFVPVMSLSLLCSVLSLLPSVFCPLLSTALFLSSFLYLIICYLLFSSPLFSSEPAFLVTFSFAISLNLSPCPIFSSPSSFSVFSIILITFVSLSFLSFFFLSPLHPHLPASLLLCLFL